MSRTACLALAVTILPALAPSAALGGIEKVAYVRNPGLPEVSGIVRSRAYEGVYWVHNDSGNPPRLFAIDAEGHTIAPEGWLEGEGKQRGGDPEQWPGIEVWSAENVDWEDIAMDRGLLYVADMGNNANARRNLGVYVLEEPDPRVVRAVRPLRFIPVAYPDQKSWPAEKWHFDCESVFVYQGRLYFLTKHRKPGFLEGFEPGTVLYRLDSERTDRNNVLVRVGSHRGVTLATAAELSPSGDRLAVLSYTKLWIFERPAQGDDWLSGPSTSMDLDREVAKQNEAITWIDEETLLMANENRDLIRVTLDGPRGAPGR